MTKHEKKYFTLSIIMFAVTIATIQYFFPSSNTVTPAKFSFYVVLTTACYAGLLYWIRKSQQKKYTTTNEQERLDEKR